MRQLSYAAMLGFCLLAVLPLDRVLGAGVLRSPRRAAAAVLPAGMVFLAWDLAATHAGQWAFDPSQTLPPRVLGVPLEEVAFFVVIPLAALLTYETVGAVLRRRGGRSPREGAP